METVELLEILYRGEDSRHQFKENFSNVNSLAAEMVALANAQGGKIIVGVNDNGEITGLHHEDIGRLNQLVSNAASQSVKPPINPLTENVATDSGLVMVITVPEGLNKPYMDNQVRIWVKNGADKRQVTSREEMQRMFQASGLVYADELPVPGATLADLDMEAFRAYYERRFEQSLEEVEIEPYQVFENLGLARDGQINLAGLLLFGNNPQQFRPAFVAKAIVYPADVVDEGRFLDSEDISGNLAEMYEGMFAFVQRNLHRIQGNGGINEPGAMEIPRIVLEELLVNALVHRDYFISAPIRLFIFRDRIELISPGHLPNHLTPSQIRCGLANMRNPRLASHASHILPYRGLGTGIPRALKAYHDIDIHDDREGNQFKVTIWRRKGENQ